MSNHNHSGHSHTQTHHTSSHHSSHHTTSGGESEPLLSRSLSMPIAADGESGRSGFHITHFLAVSWKSSNQVSQAVNILWPFVPAAIILHYAFPKLHMWIFVISYIGMIPAANMVGFAGQELARKLPKVSGILIETALGSIVEIVLFLILVIKQEAGDSPDRSANEGNLIPILQAAILGSILTNLLFCLGLCFFVGGIRHSVQKFHSAVSEVGTGLLLVAGFGLLIPSAFYSALKSTVTPDIVLNFFEEHKEKYTKARLDHDILKISQVTSIFLIIAFFIYIWFNARSQHSIFDEILEQEEHADLDRADDLAKPKLTFTECVLALTLALTLVTLLAVFLVERIEDVVERGIPDQFLGLILLPLVEKAAEHLTAVDEAWDGQMNFALYHCLGPSIQTALFNGPLVILVGWALGKNIDLNFEIFMVALLLLSILVVGNFLRDGESNYLEGALLLIIYCIVAVTTWYYPNPDVATTNGVEMMEALLIAAKTTNTTIVLQMRP